MIEVGDLVRVKNKYLRPNLVNCFGRTRWTRGFRHFRGKQFIGRVVEIVEPRHFDHRGKWTPAIVKLDIRSPRAKLEVINEHWLQIHRKHRRRERVEQSTAGS